MTQKSISGFTLIEISIVLVIIGLVVGGVLVGQDLICAAEVRATVSQIERYNVAVNTFKGKYDGSMPGDMNGGTALTYGFTPRGSLQGQGDGNGVIEGIVADYPNYNCGYCLMAGETGMFWVDLTTANGMNLNLIEGSFSTATPTHNEAPNWFSTQLPGTVAPTLYPEAKIGNGNYIYVWSGGPAYQPGFSGQSDGKNYFGISQITGFTAGWVVAGAPGLTVQQAYQIDKKVDDGLPQSGRVVAAYVSQFAIWSPGAIYVTGGGVAEGSSNSGFPTTGATTGSTATCYDNSTSSDGQTASNGNPQHYSLEINGGSSLNCGLSFMFQ